MARVFEPADPAAARVVGAARATVEEFDLRTIADCSRVEMAFWLGQLSHAVRTLVVLHEEPVDEVLVEDIAGGAS